MTAEDPRIARLREQVKQTQIADIFETPEIVALLAAYDDRGRQIDAALAAIEVALNGNRGWVRSVLAVRAALTTTPEKPEVTK